ncbi:MAG: hypothetical protein KF779_18680 [Hyphomonadaceae bacterium]|nr:hypothetical protein [Hyphomonadaceae bacterium]
MRNFLMSAMALAAVVVIPGVASADDVADRTHAISICRAEVQAQAGADASVRFDQVRVRPRAVRVDLDVWRNGSLQNVRCVVERGGPELTIASISPTLQTASLAR